MAKAARGDAQYMLRLPGGLRDRIKAYSERMGTSMNSEIVRVLEIEFPEQWPVEDKLTELGELLSVLSAGKEDPRFAEFSAKLEETITGIVSGRVTDVDPETRGAIASMWEDYKMRESESAMDSAEDHYWGRTDEEIAAYEITGNFEKYERPLPRPLDPLRDDLHLMDILPPAALAELADRLSKLDVEGAADVLKAVPKNEISRRVEFHKLPLIARRSG
ncbi:Arc family DNA-binding protein [Ensifer sp. ENS05]|uniref:Arc family DNA-binding protein n=1 Tax=Ensifer sp. ENS05 TaxID=2769277 RepID=UPI00177DA88A|nr:Arc family DNA-binding protein [Ensifer sp. ENS05]MBD9592710.1 Arc family DNA-binding protein [Ensifer sp. ENS05]